MQANHPETIQEFLDLPEELDERLQIPTRGFLFHGSPDGSIEVLEPRQAYHYGLADGDPAVCAAEDIYRSIFISLLNRNILDDPSSAGSGWSRDGDNPTVYKATQNLLNAAQTAVGYLYLLDPDNFSWVELADPKHSTKRELRSLEPVRPIAKIKVRIPDFPHPIEIMELGES